MPPVYEEKCHAPIPPLGRPHRTRHFNETLGAWPEVGLIVTDSPYDPQPMASPEAGRVVEMDGRLAGPRLIDLFIADHA